MMSRGVTLEQLEERILLIAEEMARSRQQRRERERRKREASLDNGGYTGNGWGPTRRGPRIDLKLIRVHPPASERD